MQILYVHDDRTGFAWCLVHAQEHLATDHEACYLSLVSLSRDQLSCILAASKHCDGVGQFQHFADGLVGRAKAEGLAAAGHLIAHVEKGFESLAVNKGRGGQIDEESPVRTERYPYRGKLADRDDYDKLDVEDVYLPRSALVLRLPMVYGEHDYQLREEFILRRVRAGRSRIPFGAGTWLACRGYVRDVARAVRLALQTPDATGVMNVCEDRTFSMRMWSQMILDAAGSDAELVRVPDELLPEDLKPTGTMPQHIAASSRKAQARLGWSPSDPFETLRTTVRWHLQHPPEDADHDFAPDEAALNSV